MHNKKEQFHQLFGNIRAEKFGFLSDDEINAEIQITRAEVKKSL